MDLIISNASGKPIYEQIYTQIKNSILSGELSPGDALPSIRALAKSLHITTSAVHMRLLRAKECAVNRWNLSLEEVMK